MVRAMTARGTMHRCWSPWKKAWHGPSLEVHELDITETVEPCTRPTAHCVHQIRSLSSLCSSIAQFILSSPPFLPPCFPGCSLHAFGSYTMNLTTSNGDLDLSLNAPRQNHRHQHHHGRRGVESDADELPPSRDERIRVLHRAAVVVRHLHRGGWLCTALWIPRRRQGVDSYSRVTAVQCGAR